MDSGPHVHSGIDFARREQVVENFVLYVHTESSKVGRDYHFCCKI
jgi:hypothetical protein